MGMAYHESERAEGKTGNVTTEPDDLSVSLIRGNQTIPLCSDMPSSTLGNDVPTAKTHDEDDRQVLEDGVHGNRKELLMKPERSRCVSRGANPTSIPKLKRMNVLTSDLEPV
jgi:hypothetical protein